MRLLYRKIHAEDVRNMIIASLERNNYRRFNKHNYLI